MVKSLNATVDRWQRKVATAEQDYLAGVQNPTKDWQQAALQSEQSYNEGITAAMQQRAWANGVGQVSTQEWQRKTLEKSPRWRQGVGVAAGDYAQSMQVVLQNVEATVNDVDRSVGPRGAKGSEQNINRSVAFQRGMHERTLQGRGGIAPGQLVTEPISVDQFGRPLPRVMEPISVDRFGRPIIPPLVTPPGATQPPILGPQEQQPIGLAPQRGRYTPRSF